MNRECPPRPENRKVLHTLRGIAASAVGIGLLLGSITPVQADELDQRRQELTASIASQTDAVANASTRLTSAAAALEAAVDELGAAESELEAAEAARRDAEALDAQRAEELAAAEHAVQQAEAEVAAARAALESVKARSNEEIVVITQQSGPLLRLALLVTDVSAAEMNQRAQLSTTLFDSSARQMDELEMRRISLDAAEARADEARAAAADARQAAADQLKDSTTKEAAAVALRARVEDKVVARDAAAEEAGRQLEAERDRQASLEAESADVDRRIAERIAAQKAAEEAAAKKAAEEAARKAAEEAAARKAAAEAAAREAAAKEAAARKAAEAQAAAAAAAAREAAASVPTHQPGAPRPTGDSTSTPAVSSSGFRRPVAGRITSSYGMRLHPVLGVRKLHDGTDFAAACGTPMRAAADGVVAERYYNAGYGNRLMIDHGRVEGSYVTTGYNHAQRYTVSVGQRVSRGQTIGYVGTTGYSTGCHLHLMVWEDGSTVNPMTNWFS